MSTKNTKPAIAPQVDEVLSMATDHAKGGMPAQGSSTASAKLNTAVTSYEADGTGKTTKNTYSASVTVGQMSSTTDALPASDCDCADSGSAKSKAAPAPSEKKSS